jgi:SEC-C motif-containing protein
MAIIKFSGDTIHHQDEEVQSFFTENIDNQIMKKQTKRSTDLCPCGSGRTYTLCCQLYLQQDQLPATAEQLMRSRYTAFALNDEDYLLFSWHPQTCPQHLELDEKTQWLGLQIKNTERGQEHDNSGHVEFIARFKLNGKAFRLHENSRFTRLDRRWVYLDGEIIA